MAFRPIVITVSADAAVTPFERHGEPVRVGVACPRGAVQRSERWGLGDQRGRSVPVQTAVLDRWGDGSVRWLLAEFQADVLPNAAAFYALAPEGAGEPPRRRFRSSRRAKSCGSRREPCAVLLKYAMWMSANERPYLDTPEKLEDPTETWAAQDLRKAAVFEFAARHTRDNGARACFLARADSFVDYAVSTLLRSPTGRLTRPLVLLLAYAFQRPAADLAAAKPPVAIKAFERERFRPLRRRLARKLAWAGAGLSAAAVLVIVLLIS